VLNLEEQLCVVSSIDRAPNGTPIFSPRKERFHAFSGQVDFIYESSIVLLIKRYGTVKGCFKGSIRTPNMTPTVLYYSIPLYLAVYIHNVI
jgi:hypothetical protein